MKCRNAAVDSGRHWVKLRWRMRSCRPIGRSLFGELCIPGKTVAHSSPNLPPVLIQTHYTKLPCTSNRLSLVSFWVTGVRPYGRVAAAHCCAAAP